MKFTFLVFSLLCLCTFNAQSQTSKQGALVDALVQSLEMNNLLYLYDGDTLFINVNDPVSPGMYYYANEIVSRSQAGNAKKPEFFLNLDIRNNTKVDFKLRNLESYYGYFTLAEGKDLVVSDLQYIISEN